MTEPPDALPPLTNALTVPTMGLPEPHLLRRALSAGLDESYEAVTADRPVHRPEDTFDVQRRLTKCAELLADYGRAFTDASKRARGYQVDELRLAVGEQDEIPNQGLTVPDAEGDVRLSLDFVSDRDFDLCQLVNVVAARAAASTPVDADPDEIAAAAIGEFLTLGAFTPQVSKVTAYAKTLARSGEDLMASVVNSSISTRRVYRGVKVERKENKA